MNIIGTFADTILCREQALANNKENKMTITTKMQLADNLAAAIADGGATMSTTDGSPIRNGYTIGGGIVKTADALATFPLSLGARAIRNGIYMELMASGEELKEFEAVGIWVSNGVVYLDAVTVESSFIKAVITGIQRKQQAIGSLKAGAYEEVGLRAAAKPTTIQQPRTLAMANNESGFSLIELVVAAGIMAALSAMAFNSFQGVSEGIKAKQEQAQEMEQNQAAEIQWVLDNLGN